MSIFDKFFSNRNRNNNENVVKAETKGLRSSHLSISKEQIRFVLFRECDKRGRKLLFDSNSVEKVPLPSSENMCDYKCQKSSEKSTEFIETNKTHGYKYKKPPSDVAILGEMVFGSVAVVYKAENSCKIHCIPSPKRLMFTTIVHAPFCRGPTSIISELNLDHSSGSSLASITNTLNQQVTSSSDSKLYRHKGVVHKYSSTYPWIKHSFPGNKMKQCCEISDVDFKLTAKSFLHETSELKCLENSYPEKETNKSVGAFSVLSGNNLGLCQKTSDCEGCSLSNYGSSGITSNESGNISSGSGSLISLRRRWAHSYSTSLDSTACDDTSGSPSRKRTKLGMALILDMSNTLESEVEKLLFNHTILIDGLMCKLQDSVEGAYIRNENFVDLIYTAFLECQESIYELITGGKYETPIWCTVLGGDEDGLEAQLTRMSLCKKNIGMCNKRDILNNIQLKFLNDFCDVLAKFDTKDTNFFISTLLTAVLTHHLSWVSSIAESDPKSPKEKLFVMRWENNEYGEVGSFRSRFSATRLRYLERKDQDGEQPVLRLYVQSIFDASAVVHGLINSPEVLIHNSWTRIALKLSGRPYNPIWAQMNDLCGLLGSPLKSAKTIVTGPESKKNHLAVIVEILSYFIRCNNVVENMYEVDIENIIGSSDVDSKKTADLDSAIDSDDCSSSAALNLEKPRPNSKEKSTGEVVGGERHLGEDVPSLRETGVRKSGPEGGLKRSKSCLSGMKVEEPPRPKDLYPDIKDLAKSENINIEDLNEVENERTIFVENLLSSEELKEKIQKMIRVPSNSVKPHAEEYLSPDEGYDTIDSTKTDNYKANKVQMERQRSAPEYKKENIVFLLGENEELVNLPKKVVVSKSSFVDMEKENSREFPPQEEQRFSGEGSQRGEGKTEGDHRTLENLSDGVDRTFWVNHGGENIYKHSSNKDGEPARKPRIVREIEMPRAVKPCRTRRLEVSSMLGGVNQQYNSEQVIQGVLKPKSLLERTLQKDLYLSAHNRVLEKNVTEALCIVGDMESWEVTILSSCKSALDSNKRSGIRVGMSQLVADMLESFLYLHTSNLSPNFCLLHIEKKLQEIYLKSQMVAELLSSTELCSMDYLTTSLDIGINDVPLLLSVATTYAPQIAEKYVISYS